MIYKVELKEKVDDLVLEKLKRENEEKEGIQDLFNELIMLGRCETYTQSRALYVANTLQTEKIEFTFKTIQ